MHAPATVVFQNTLENLLVLNKFFGTPASIGVLLLKQQFEAEPWITVQEMAKTIDISEDTVRRRLTDLAAINRVDVCEESGRRRYALNPKTARAVIDRMVWDHTVLGEVPAIPQIAVADCD